MAAVAVSPRESVVPNFRKAVGVKNVYRCSAPDRLADVLDSETLFDHERFILYDATLLIDLRSPIEGDVEKRRILREGAPGGSFEEVNSLEAMKKSVSDRLILRFTDCVLTKGDFIDYVAKNWVEGDGSKGTGDGDEIFAAINEHGLTGFVEVILEKKAFISDALKAITIHLEERKDGKVIIHCSAGKDRAGVLSMLCGSVLGVTDEDIINDFAKSECIRALAEEKYARIFKGQIDSVDFSNADPETMMISLDYLRTKYGSINEYLDSAGFDESWRTRFKRVAST